MKLIGIASAAQFAEHRLALKWAKEHLPEDEYRRIDESYRLLLKWTAVFVLCCIPIMFACLSLVFFAPFSRMAENAARPDGASDYVMARINYDGAFYWTHDSQVYEHALSDYGLSPEDYAFGDRVKVYVDEAQNVIGVRADADPSRIREIEVVVGIVATIVVPTLLILAVYRPIAQRSFGREWAEFYRDYNG